MKTSSSRLLWIVSLLASGFALSPAAGAQKTINAPGFRPGSELAAPFLEHLRSCRIAVLPTVIRTKRMTMHSEASQKAVVAFLNERKLGIPEARKVEFDIGALKGKNQMEWFQNDRRRFGEIVRAQSGADYYLALEYLIPRTPSGDIAVFGMHIYVLDANGESAFSFLLNSHHKILADAGLKAVGPGEHGLEALALKADRVALAALMEQIKQARQSEPK